MRFDLKKWRVNILFCWSVSQIGTGQAIVIDGGFALR
jgi:hypothetical protein